MKNFEKNVELDAQIVYVAMNGDIDALAQYAFRQRHIFSSPDDVFRRANWLKTQSDEYIKEVSDRVVKLEANKTVILPGGSTKDINV